MRKLRTMLGLLVMVAAAWAAPAMAANIYVSGTVTAVNFIGDGAGLTNIGTNDRISTTGVASGATLGAVVADRGTVSFTLAGVAGAAYLHSTLGLVVPAISTTTGNVAGVRLLVSTNDSAATPGLTWGGDPNTGMFQVAADTIGFATNGTEAMRIDASNRVGINTALTASATLSVNGNILTNANLMAGTGSGASEGGQLILGYPGIMPTTQMNSTWNMDVDSLKNLRFFRQNVSGSTFSPIVMTEAGPVGIGNISTPSTTLHVAGSIRLANGGETCDANRAGTMRYTSGVFQICDGVGYASILDTSATITNAAIPDRLVSSTSSLIAGSNGGFTVSSSVGTTMYLIGSGTSDQALRIGATRSGNGNSYLDLVGDATYSTFGLRIVRGNGGPNTSSFIQHRGTGGLFIQTQEAAPLVFVTSATESMRILANGNVGIGTTAPASALQVDTGFITVRNNTDDWGLKFSRTDNSQASGIKYVSSSVSAPALQFVTQDIGRMYLANNGYIGMANNNPGTDLDIGDNTVATQTLLRLSTKAATSATQVLFRRGAVQSYLGPSAVGTFDIQAAEAIPMIFYTTAAERMRILANGNVGINSVAPTGKLEVLADALGGTVNNTGVVQRWSQSNGNVGILDVVGLRTNTGTGWGNAAMRLQASVDGSKMGYLQFNGTGNDYGISFGTGGNANYYGVAERMRIDTNGNVGIGTTSPSNTLHVDGSFRVDGRNQHFNNDTGIPSTTLLITGNAAAVATVPFGDYQYNGQLMIRGASNTDKRLALGVDTSAGTMVSVIQSVEAGLTARALLLNPSGGFVGIGTTNPLNPLHVKSANGAIAYLESTSTDPNGVLYIKVPGTNSCGNLTCSELINFNVGNADIGTITPNAAGTGVSYNTSSDRRLKTDIVSSTMGLATLMQIPVHEFSFKSDKKHTRIQGFIAQEIKVLYPDAVATNGDNGTTPLVSGTRPWSVDYGRLTPLLVQSIQDLKKENDALKAQNATILKRLEALEKR